MTTVWFVYDKKWKANIDLICKNVISNQLVSCGFVFKEGIKELEFEFSVSLANFDMKGRIRHTTFQHQFNISKVSCIARSILAHQREMKSYSHLVIFINLI